MNITYFPYSRPTWVEVNLDAIKENVQTFRSHLRDEAKIMAVVKADGYGHGAVPVAQAAVEAGASSLGVASLEEALALRQAGLQVPILVLGYTAPPFVGEAIRNDIQLTVSGRELLLAYEREARKKGEVVSLQLKVDTGMGRIGFRSAEELLAALRAVEDSPFLRIDGLFTHFACADEEEQSFTEEQYRRFTSVLQFLAQHGRRFAQFHCCNSAAAMRHPEWGASCIRLGISLYGLPPSPALKQTGLRLTPALSFKTRIVHLKEVPAGTPISYGATFVAKRPTKVATIPVGYGDGYPRALSNRASVLVRGVRVPVIGRVCMDQTMIDVTDVPTAALEDEVVLYGKQGREEISVEEIAALLGTIPYEVTCQIDKRVPRFYIRNGRIATGENGGW
ncbi:alanine racemase [Bacillaceae bacterium]